VRGHQRVQYGFLQRKETLTLLVSLALGAVLGFVGGLVARALVGAAAGAAEGAAAEETAAVAAEGDAEATGQGFLRNISGCNSFAAGTAVLIADGSTKPIQDIKVGDKITNSDPESTIAQQHTVTAVHVTDTDTDFTSLSVATPAGPKTITVTAHHLFWDGTKHIWTTASDLKPGDLLDTGASGVATVLSSWEFTSSIRTYNLTVDGLHTFYVVAGATPLLAHNCPEGYTSSPAFKDDPYNPDVVAARSAANQELYGPTVADRAAELGYKTRIPAQKAPFKSMGQPVFSNGDNYITQDITEHNVSNGWKMFDRHGRRVGTFDENLNYLKK
jgi:hypothetical protein